MVKNPPAMQETWIQSPGWEDPVGKGMATHSNILAWRTPWTEEPRGWRHRESDRAERPSTAVLNLIYKSIWEGMTHYQHWIFQAMSVEQLSISLDLFKPFVVSCMHIAPVRFLDLYLSAAFSVLVYWLFKNSNSYCLLLAECFCHERMWDFVKRHIFLPKVLL